MICASFYVIELVMRSISSSLFKKEQIFTLYIEKFYTVKNSFDYEIQEKKNTRKNSLISKINYYFENRIFLNT